MKSIKFEGEKERDIRINKKISVHLPLDEIRYFSRLPEPPEPLTSWNSRCQTPEANTEMMRGLDTEITYGQKTSHRSKIPSS